MSFIFGVRQQKWKAVLGALITMMPCIILVLWVVECIIKGSNTVTNPLSIIRLRTRDLLLSPCECAGRRPHQ